MNWRKVTYFFQKFCVSLPDKYKYESKELTLKYEPSGKRQ
jgi:hypothetical protein